MDGESDRRRGVGFGPGEIALLVTERAAGGLEVQRDRVVDLRLDPAAQEELQQAVAILGVELVKMVDVRLFRIARWQDDLALQLRQRGVEELRVGDACVRDPAKILDLVQADDRL